MSDELVVREQAMELTRVKNENATLLAELLLLRSAIPRSVCADDMFVSGNAFLTRAVNPEVSPIAGLVRKTHGASPHLNDRYSVSRFELLHSY